MQQTVEVIKEVFFAQRLARIHLFEMGQTCIADPVLAGVTIVGAGATRFSRRRLSRYIGEEIVGVGAGVCRFFVEVEREALAACDKVRISSSK